MITENNFEEPFLSLTRCNAIRIILYKNGKSNKYFLVTNIMTLKALTSHQMKRILHTGSQILLYALMSLSHSEGSLLNSDWFVNSWLFVRFFLQQRPNIGIE